MNDYRIYNKGITLLEVLLYIGLFSVTCISAVYLYISISKMGASIHSATNRVEIAFFVYEIARYKLDHSSKMMLGSDVPKLTIDDFSRIMKYYPSFELKEVLLELETNKDESDSGVFGRFKITYKIIQKGIHAHSSTEKIFSNMFYVIM